MNDESEHQEWILCPKCGNKTRLKLRKDTVLTNFPLFCPKCKEEAQNAPTPVTTYALFYNGAYLTNEQMNDRKFLKLLSK